MAEFQITYWRDLPSLVVVKDGGDITKSPLSARFQEAIDEAAMRLGETGSDQYLAGWQRGEWTVAEGVTAEVADDVVARLEREWSPEAVSDFLDSLGPSPTERTS